MDNRIDRTAYSQLQHYTAIAEISYYLFAFETYARQHTPTRVAKNSLFKHLDNFRSELERRYMHMLNTENLAMSDITALDILVSNQLVYFQAEAFDRFVNFINDYASTSTNRISIGSLIRYLYGRVRDVVCMELFNLDFNRGCVDSGTIWK